jgi:transposase
MDQAAFLLATVDMVPAWDFADTPFMVVKQGIDRKHQDDVPYCPVCGNKVRGYEAKQEQRRQLNSLLNEAYLHAIVPCVEYPGEVSGSKKIEIPWGRPGTGFTQLFEALVMALVRQVSVNAAAAMLDTRDARLWRVLDNNTVVAKEKPRRSEAGFPVIERRKGRNQLSLIYDLDVSFDISDKDSFSAKVFAEELKASREKAQNLDAYSAEMSKAFILAVINALLRVARTVGHFRVIKDKKEALGKVSAEEGMLYPGKGRAPPIAAR